MIGSAGSPSVTARSKISTNAGSELSSSVAASSSPGAPVPSPSMESSESLFGSPPPLSVGSSLISLSASSIDTSIPVVSNIMLTSDTLV